MSTMSSPLHICCLSADVKRAPRQHVTSARRLGTGVCNIKISTCSLTCRSLPGQRIHDKDRPDEAFTTDRAVRAGRANAASGRIMVTVPGDHFGPIPPEADPRGLVRSKAALHQGVS